jgi:hypothetical protein
MPQRRHAVFTTVAMSLALGACNGEPHIGDSYFLGWGSTPVIDAKQRAIINIKAEKRDDGISGHNEPTRIVCAEPSPDVAQAISQTMKLALEADLSRKNAAGDTESIKARSDYARSAAASVAQLGERLASVQLLRDKMYRACEAYGNGAINSTTYTTIMARFDKTMTTLMASELAAGAFGRELASTSGSATISGPPAEAVKVAENRLKDNISAYNKSLEELAKKQDAATKAKIAFDSAAKDTEKAQSELDSANDADKDAKKKNLENMQADKNKKDAENKAKQA